MEATVFYLLIPQKYTNAKQKTHKTISIVFRKYFKIFHNYEKNRIKWISLRFFR